jgi:hypothetical protein
LSNLFARAQWPPAIYLQDRVFSSIASGDKFARQRFSRMVMAGLCKSTQQDSGKMQIKTSEKLIKPYHLKCVLFPLGFRFFNHKMTKYQQE